jgi:hypothetical protein
MILACAGVMPSFELALLATIYCGFTSEIMSSLYTLRLEQCITEPAVGFSFLRE